MTCGDDEDMRKEEPQLSSARPKKQASIKKLTDITVGLLNWCTSVLNEVNDALSQSEAKLAKIPLDYALAVKETQEIEY